MATKSNQINPLLSSYEISTWIRSTNATSDDIAFGPLLFKNISRQELIEQVEGYRRSKNKLPLWYKTLNIVYPPKVSLEQCSSEKTAKYKSSVLERLFGTSLSNKTIADLTGGFGVDSYFMSTTGAKVHHFEFNQRLSAIVDNNMKQLKANITCHAEDGINALSNLKADIVYLDPARRDKQNRKVFRLENYTPNILPHLDNWLKKVDMIMIKTSPIIDISFGIQQLKAVKEIHVLAVNNEVKELVWCLSQNRSNQFHNFPEPDIYAINLGKNKPTIHSFNWGVNEVETYSEPKKYLFEPHAVLRKIGRYTTLVQNLPVKRLGPNAHIFTGEESIKFPGRQFIILESFKFNKINMKQFKRKQFNVTTRDFPISVAGIRTKWNINEGGDQYLFFTTDFKGQKWVILTEKYFLK